jgi:hypothetical protein
VPDVHLPHLEDDEDEPAAGPALQAAPGTPADQPLVRAARRSKSLLKIGLEVILISSGVFLGLMGEQWRERAQHREIAEVSLRRFRMELQTNRNAVASVRNKHVAKLKYLESYFQLYEAKDAEGRKKLAWPDTATDPAFLEYSAWDVALATQSLAYIDSDLAFSISHVYAVQQQLDGATRAVTQAMYSATDPIVFLRNGLITYFSDCTLIEPRLLTVYDEIIPRLDQALGESPGEHRAAK